jgi:hypothetical protein
MVSEDLFYIIYLLLSFGFHNKCTGWLKQEKFFIRNFLESGKSKVKVPADLSSCESPFTRLQTIAFFLCSLIVKKDRVLVFLPLLISTLIPSCALALRKSLTSGSPYSKYHRWRASIYESWGDVYIQSITSP